MCSTYNLSVIAISVMARGGVPLTCRKCVITTYQIRMRIAATRFHFRHACTNEKAIIFLMSPRNQRKPADKH